jgi:hypothetical protein
VEVEHGANDNLAQPYGVVLMSKYEATQNKSLKTLKKKQILNLLVYVFI